LFYAFFRKPRYAQPYLQRADSFFREVPERVTDRRSSSVDLLQWLPPRSEPAAREPSATPPARR
jgi:hypothetical protein